MAIGNPSALLDRLIAQPKETEWLEFKLNNGDPQLMGEYISSLANGAMLVGKDKAFLVFGVENNTRMPVGTMLKLSAQKKGNENLLNWLSRQIEPRLAFELVEFENNGLLFAIIVIEPAYDRPVRFGGIEYLRIGENKRKLSEFPEHERALWLATGRREFEDAVALTNQSVSDIFNKLDIAVLYSLRNIPEPNEIEVIRQLIESKFIIDTYSDVYEITNLGAILLAKDINAFPSIAGKAIRIIKYIGKDKARAEFERSAALGYAVGFSNMIKFITRSLPHEEKYIEGVRRMVPVYPETAIREIIANALIHQDFTISGTGPLVEIYDNRVEVINAGTPLIEPDRMLHERRSRNERLASTMRALGLCEERGGGLDKTVLEIELQHLPAPEFITTPNSFCAVLYGPRSFDEMSKADKLRACYFHCVLRWIQRDFMSNTTLRARFSLKEEEYQKVSDVISNGIKSRRIIPADPSQGKRNAKYIPYWAG